MKISLNGFDFTNCKPNTASLSYALAHNKDKRNSYWYGIPPSNKLEIRR